jgi:hypothetical protein
MPYSGAENNAESAAIGTTVRPNTTSPVQCFQKPQALKRALAKASQAPGN